MDCRDTICAISTPLGMGGLGVIRVSGDHALAVVARIFSASSGRSIEAVPTHSVHHGFIVSPASQEKIDEVLVTVMRAPRTYTREDLVEVGVHGGLLILQSVLDLLCREGARLANPGEFTLRAFLNGRLDLVQAEAVMEMISARSEEGHRAAMAQLQGVLSKSVQSIHDGLIRLLAQIEASIDFCEEGIALYSNPEMAQEVQGLIANLDALLEGYRAGKLRREGVQTTLVGRPNVGKSSLLNALLGEERAIVTPYPGTTRDVLREEFTIRGTALRLVDMAGLHETTDPIELEGLRRAVQAIEQSDLLLFVLDGSAPFHPDDAAIQERIAKKKSIIVLNKSDLPVRFPTDWISRALPGAPVVFLSCRTGSGLDELRAALHDKITSEINGVEGGIVTKTRHVEAFIQARRAMERIHQGLEAGISWEFLAVDLHTAKRAIGGILGLETPDDVINSIFQKFCIGK